MMISGIILNGGKNFFSLKGKMGRLGFLATLLGALIMTEIFCLIAAQLWYLYDPYPCWQFNVNVNFLNFHDIFSLTDPNIITSTWNQ